MRILIDECIDERFRNSLPGHDRQTARYAGLAGLTNGELLAAAETVKFDILLTVDQGLEYQQNLTGRNIAIIIFRTKSNRLKDLLPQVPACLANIESIQPGQTWSGSRSARGHERRGSS
jgi:predicted nuclease of predicted toxin-antitoxin system